MKYRCMLALALGAILFGGCSRPLTDQTDPVRVVIEGGGEFPPSVAGRWRASQYGWEFQIEPDGRISSTVIGMGRVRVTPGQTTTRPTRSGDPAIFTPGPWVVHYAPGTRELTVEIAMAHVRVEMAGNIVEGSSTDTFVGTLDPAGRTWQTQWTTFTHYRGRTADNASFDLSTDPTYGDTKPLTFAKVDDSNP